MDNKEKWTVLAELGKKLDKENGSQTFQKYDAKVGQKIDCISTGLPSVDWEVFGCGGIPKGRIIEIYGEESSGKTALCSHIIGQCQKAGGIAAFIDAEHALEPSYASVMGVDMSKLLIAQPDFGEQALEIVIALVESKAVDLIVVDSVSALVPRAELEGEMGDSHMGLMARMMSQCMRKLVGITSKSSTTIIFINQVRDKIGLVFGNPETTSGGKALRFAATARIRVAREAQSKGGQIKDGEEIIGHKMKVKAHKNKAGAPFKETVIDLLYASGFDMVDDLINHAQKIGLVEGNAWMTLKGEQEKYRRDELPIDKIRASMAEYYSNLFKEKE